MRSNPHSGWTVRHHPHLGILLVFAFTWPVELALVAQSLGRLPFTFPEFVGVFVGYGVAAGALLAATVGDGRRGVRSICSRLLIWRVGLRWYLCVLVGPAVVGGAALWIDWALGGQPDFADVLVFQVAPPAFNLWALAPIWLVWEALSNGEEIGWRGYVLPWLLTRHDARVASVILGLIWAVWHLPKYMMGGIQSAVRQSYPFWLFVVVTVSLSVLFTWIYRNTQGSLLLAILFHAAVNTVLMCLPIAPGTRPFLIMMGIQCVLAVVVGWRLNTGPGSTDDREQAGTLATPVVS